MATKADIVIRARDDASKTIARFTKMVEESASRGADAYSKLGRATRDNIDAHRTLFQTLKNLGLTAEEADAYISRLSAAVQTDTSEVNNLRAATAALDDATRALGGTVDQTTDAVERQSDSLVRMPTYLVGYRGGWMNLIVTMTTGLGVFTAMRRVIMAVGDEMGEAIQRDREAAAAVGRWTEKIQFGADVAAQSFVPAVKEGVGWLDRFEESTIAALNRGGELVDRILQAIPIWQQYTQALEDHIVRSGEVVTRTDETKEAVERLAAQYQALIDQHAEETFEAQAQAIFDSSRSAGEYTLRLMDLLQAHGLLIPLMRELGLEALNQGIALDHAARQAEKFKETIERFRDMSVTARDALSGIQDYTRDLGDIQDTYADRTQDTLFRAGQAWESYQFRMGQTMAAGAFRVDQIEDRFEHSMASRLARMEIAAIAATEREALSIQSIKEDHYDRLRDMESNHQEEMRRMLQRAPWYLQGPIRDYQRQRQELEERGDKEGLAQLKKNFMERIRTIDPIYAEELEHLKDTQREERDVEDREFRQRLDRTRVRADISRRQREAQDAITLADMQFAFDQQLKAQEFAQEQRLASMEFAYQQQKAASDRASGEALRDYQKALADRGDEFARWAKEQTPLRYSVGYEHGSSYTSGVLDGMLGPPERPFGIPGATSPMRGLQAGMSYVPTTMPVIVHPGEAVLPRGEAAAWRSGGVPPIYINFYGPIYMRTRQQISELATDISREIGRRAFHGG